MSLNRSYKYQANRHLKPKRKQRLRLLVLALLCAINSLLIYKLFWHQNAPAGNYQPSQTGSVNDGPQSSPLATTENKPAAQAKNTQPPAFLPNLTFSHKNIVTTVFWVGEPADSDNGHIANVSSVWDEQWQSHYGGVDSPTDRHGFLPAAFTPHENPFYVALPYNDFTNDGNRKSTASACPNSANASVKNYSWCKNAWVGLRCGLQTAYGQWEDSGPFGEDDTAYVFGNAAPKNNVDVKAGLDVSPALHDYLKLQDVSRCDWTFVAANQVPAGPWKQIVTTTKGEAVSN